MAAIRPMCPPLVLLPPEPARAPASVRARWRRARARAECTIAALRLDPLCPGAHVDGRRAISMVDRHPERVQIADEATPSLLLDIDIVVGCCRARLRQVAKPGAAELFLENDRSAVTQDPRRHTPIITPATALDIGGGTDRQPRHPHA